MATKRPADSDDECCPGPTKAKRVEATPDSAATGESYRATSRADTAAVAWGTLFSGNEVVWHGPTHDWMTDVASVTLGGDVHCNFIMQQVKHIDVALASTYQSVQIASTSLSTSPSTIAHFALRAHLLVDQCLRLRSTGQCHTITQVVQPASLSVSDSNNEQVPDPERPPAFTEAELSVLNHIYSMQLWPCFQDATRLHFQNAQGKIFLPHWAVSSPVCTHQLASHSIDPLVVPLLRGMPNLVV